MRTRPQTDSTATGMPPAGVWRFAIRLMASALVALLAVSAAWALQSLADAQTPPNDSFIRRAVTDDAYRFEDVYRVKIVNGKRFKRLMLHEDAFCAYDCPWDDVLPSDRSVMDGHTISWLGRLGGNEDVYLFLATGEDSGIRQHLKMERSEIERKYDWDSIFSTEPNDFYAYRKGRDITCGDLNVCDPPPIQNRPPVINVQGPLTLTAGQQVTGELIATVTDPDDTLQAAHMSVRGLPPGNDWRAVYNRTSGRLTISGTVSSSTAGSWTVEIYASDGTETSQQEFQIAIVDDTSKSTPPANTNVSLDYDDGVGCQISDVNGDGQPSYQPGQEVLLSCPVNNTDSTSRWVYLHVALRHSATGRWQPAYPVDRSAVKKAPAGTQRQWARFAIPTDWPDGDTTANVMLRLWETDQWLDRNTQMTEPFVIAQEQFRMVTAPAFDTPRASAGSTVTVSWRHRNPFPYAIADEASLELVCSDRTYANASETISLSADATTTVKVDLSIARDAPRGACRLDFTIFSRDGRVIEGWTGPLNQRQPQGRISLTIVRSLSVPHCSTPTTYSSTDGSGSSSRHLVVRCKVSSYGGGRITFEGSIRDAAGATTRPIERSADVSGNATIVATFRVPISPYIKPGQARLVLAVYDDSNDDPLFRQTRGIQIPEVPETEASVGCSLKSVAEQVAACVEKYTWAFWKTAGCITNAVYDFVVECANELADAIDAAVEWVDANVGGCLKDLAEGAIEGSGAESTSWCTIIGDFGMAVIPVVGDLRDAVICVADGCSLAEWALNIAGAVPIAGSVVDIAATATKRLTVKGVANIDPKTLQKAAEDASRKNPDLGPTKKKVDDAIATVAELKSLSGTAARLHDINETDLLDMVTAVKNAGARTDFKRVLKTIQTACPPSRPGTHCRGNVLEIRLAVQKSKEGNTIVAMPGSEKGGKWLYPTSGTGRSASTPDIVYETPSGELRLVESRTDSFPYSATEAGQRAERAKALGESLNPPRKIGCIEFAVGPGEGRTEATRFKAKDATGIYEAASAHLLTWVILTTTGEVFDALDSCSRN